MNALTFPSGPCALVTAGSLMLAVCSDAVHVYDLEHAKLIQSLHFPLDQQPAPDQQLLACSNTAASGVLVAGYRKVCLLALVSATLHGMLMECNAQGSVVDLRNSAWPCLYF